MGSSAKSEFKLELYVFITDKRQLLFWFLMHTVLPVFAETNGSEMDVLRLIQAVFIKPFLKFNIIWNCLVCFINKFDLWLN